MSITTTITWNPAHEIPDADINVLGWVHYHDGTVDWTSCFYDGVDWRECESGGVVNGVVTHWAQPEGPTA